MCIFQCIFYNFLWRTNYTGPSIGESDSRLAVFFLLRNLKGGESLAFILLTSPLSLKLTCNPALAGDRSVGDSAGCAGRGGGARVRAGNPPAATPHSMPPLLLPPLRLCWRIRRRLTYITEEVMFIYLIYCTTSCECLGGPTPHPDIYPQKEPEISYIVDIRNYIKSY